MGFVMCGICGFNWDDKKLIKSMADSIIHRGPDDSGFYTDRGISLGSRRLSIIDLATGKQPIYNEDKSMCIVFNGEIYNFRELKEELEKKGHEFYTNSDTEAVLHAYEEYGEDCVNHFNGMWAIAIWNSKKKELFLSVDRLGIKQLYYTSAKNSFLFASEIKALLQCKDVAREIDLNSFAEYLTFRYTPTERTIFKGIKKLLPGHYLVLSKDRIKIRKYWDIQNHYIENEPIDHHSEKILELLKDSVKKRLMSEVPLGAHLSGGLDSSAVVALMKTLMGTEVKTFSVAFDAEEPFNESRYAKMLAEYYGTDHQEITIKGDAIKYLPDVIWHLDDLDSDPTIIAQYLLSELTKKKVTVVLTGEGADELFGGYDEFRFLSYGKKYLSSMPRPVRSLIASAVKLAPNALLDRYFHFASALGERGKEKFAEFMWNAGNLEKSYLLLNSFFSEDEKKVLYSNELYDFEKKNVDYAGQIKPYFDGVTKNNVLNKLIYMDIKRRMPHHLLHKIDKMTMAHSVEGRVPFLDYRLVEYSFRIPPEHKLRGNVSKFVLRKAVKSLVPKEILERKKHPFVVPFDSWFRQGLKDLAGLVFDKSNLMHGKYFKYEPAKSIIKKYEKSKLYYGRQIWSLISFDVWHKIYIENGDMKNPPKDLYKMYS